MISKIFQISYERPFLQKKPKDCIDGFTQEKHEKIKLQNQKIFFL